MEDALFSETVPNFNYDDGNSLCKATGNCLICHSCGIEKYLKAKLQCQKYQKYQKCQKPSNMRSRTVTGPGE